MSGSSRPGYQVTNEAGDQVSDMGQADQPAGDDMVVPPPLLMTGPGAGALMSGVGHLMGAAAASGLIHILLPSSNIHR